MTEPANIAQVDELVREWLLFRGFTATWNSYSAELASDCSCEFQATRLADLVLKDLIPNGKGRQLVEVLDFVAAQCVGHLPLSHQPLASKMQVAVLQMYLVTAVRAGAYERVSAFFSANGERLLQGQGAEAWSRWFALPYLSPEAAQAELQVYFTKEWAALMEASLRNFLAEAIAGLPLPGLLRQHEQQQALQQRLADAEAQVSALQQQLQAAQQQQSGSEAAAHPASGQAARAAARSRSDAASGRQLPNSPASRLAGAQHAAQHPSPSTHSAATLVRSSTPEGSRQARGSAAAGHEGTSAEPVAHASHSVASSAGRTTPGSDTSSSESSMSAVADVLRGHDAEVTCCSFSPDGRNAATAAADGVVRVWGPAVLPNADVNRTAMLQCGAPVSALTWDLRAGKLLLVGMRGGKGIKCWHADTKHMVAADLGAAPAGAAADAGEVLALATSPVEPLFASSTAVPGQPLSSSLTLWNMRSFKRVGSLPAGKAPAASLTFSPNGALLAAATTHGTAQLFSTHNREPVAAWQVGSRPGGRCSIAWLLDGGSVATLSADGQLQTWDLRDLQTPAPLDRITLPGSVSGPPCLATSPDRQQLAATAGGQITLVGVGGGGGLSAAGQPVQLGGSASGCVTSIDWHRDGALLACACGSEAVVVRVPSSG